MGTAYKLQVAGYRFEATNVRKRESTKTNVNAGDICRYPTCNP
jgi:hypothetical protein